MLKFIILKTKRHRKDQGFTMLEVLVAGLIAFFFILGSLQAMVLATMIRVQSLEKERANELIQEDKEAIKARANNFKIPIRNTLIPGESVLTNNDINLSNLCSPPLGSPTLGVARLFKDAPTKYRDDPANLARYFDLGGGLGGEESQGAAATPLDIPTNKKVLNTYSDTSAQAPGRTLRLFRTYTIGQYPYKTLIINYQVNRTIDGVNPDANDPNSLIATDTLEVMPNVALQCP